MSVLGLVIAMIVTTVAPAAAVEADHASVPVIVRANDVELAMDLVKASGGSIGTRLNVIGGFEADVPQSAVSGLIASHAIVSVTPDVELQLSNAGWDDASATFSATADATSDVLFVEPGSLYDVTNYVQAREAWGSGYTGAGVDIALIDPGVAPVDGLTRSGKVINGPDLSFESQYDNLRYLDTYGHGTHMAGIMAGFDDQTTARKLPDNTPETFMGVAPEARIVSIKVADAHGITDVSQVIAATDRVVEHKDSDGLNIRVLNLSFGTDSVQSYVLDPLAFAVERAWDQGIVVVVAAGNDGPANALRNPAMDPFVIAVGAVDQNKTTEVSDDFVATFSNCGTSTRHVDVIAPGRTMMGLRAPGSFIDLENPNSVGAEGFMPGSGTSQAAAVISGVAALVVDAHPRWTPDEVKYALTGSASPLATDTSAQCQGDGVADAYDAAKTRLPRSGVTQTSAPATGLGTLDAARGTDRITADGVVLEGEIDIMGQPWDSQRHVAEASTDSAWDGGTWNGTSWSGTSWSGLSWSGLSWSGTSWSGTSWSGTSWSGLSWSGGAWSDASWTGTSWSGTSWSSLSWSGLSWSGLSWSSPTRFGLRWD